VELAEVVPDVPEHLVFRDQDQQCHGSAGHPAGPQPAGGPPAGHTGRDRCRVDDHVAAAALSCQNRRRASQPSRASTTSRATSTATAIGLTATSRWYSIG